MNAFLQKLQKWKINEKRSSIHGTLMNRQLLQFAALVSRKIARYPTRRVSSIFNTGDGNLLLFLFASFNYFHVKLTWFHSSTGCSLSLSLSLSLYLFTFLLGKHCPRRNSMKSHVTRFTQECRELTAYGIEKFHKNEPVWFSNYPPRRRDVAPREESQGLFKVSNIGEEDDIQQRRNP